MRQLNELRPRRVKRVGSQSFQRGAATLMVVVLLYLGMVTVAIFSNKHLIVQQRADSDRVRSAVAREAAEAGLHWAAAMLNQGGAVDQQCRVRLGSSSDPRFADRFRDRLESSLEATQGASAGVVASCVSVPSGAGWNCSCQPGVSAQVTPAASSPKQNVGASFAIGIAGHSKGGAVDVISHGCAGPMQAAACAGGGGVKLQITLARLTGSAQAPLGALVEDPAVNAKLMELTGTYVRVPGSWRDF